MRSRSSATARPASAGPFLLRQPEPPGRFRRQRPAAAHHLAEQDGEREDRDLGQEFPPTGRLSLA